MGKAAQPPTKLLVDILTKQAEKDSSIQLGAYVRTSAVCEATLEKWQGSVAALLRPDCAPEGLLSWGKLKQAFRTIYDKNPHVGFQCSRPWHDCELV